MLYKLLNKNITKHKTKEEIYEKLKEMITRISVRIDLFKEVKEHMINGGAARGVVWEYSPYMTIEEVETIIKELKTLEVYLKNIYSELLIEKELEDVDEDLKSIFRLEIKDFGEKNLDNLNRNLDELIKKFDLKD